MLTEAFEKWCEEEEVDPGSMCGEYARRGWLAGVAAATVAEPSEMGARGHGIHGVPRAAFGPHTEADRIDHCGSCGAENGPQEDDLCPTCGAENALISTWGEFQHTRYRNGERYANCGPQWWEDGPQPSIEEAAQQQAKPVVTDHSDDAIKMVGQAVPAGDERAALADLLGRIETYAEGIKQRLDSADYFGEAAPDGLKSAPIYAAAERALFILGCVKEMRTKLAAQSGQRAGVAEGWMLVPEEPTFEMLEAGDMAWDSASSARERYVYKAMLAAAPTQQQERSE